MLETLKNYFYHHLINRQSLKTKFSTIYQHNIFGGKDSISGAGSNLEQTATIRQALPLLLQQFGIRTMLDAPCGDWFWMKEINLDLDHYIGIDIVDALIAANNLAYATENRQFLCRNIVEDQLPKVDLILCRDCLVHLSYQDIVKSLLNFKQSGSQYLLTTTFSNRDNNKDLTGRNLWRTLNLEIAPFHFPKPLALINENCSEMNGAYQDKCLALWRLEDILHDG